MIVWFRRDLRVADHPALLAAVQASRSANAPLVALFVVDPVLMAGAGPHRVTFLLRALRALRSCGVPLVVRVGEPGAVVAEVARSTGSKQVYCSEDFSPYGVRRDRRVCATLASIGARLDAVGSPYAVAPGSLVSKSGSGFRVFTPFHRAWVPHCQALQPYPALDPSTVTWRHDTPSDPLPAEPLGGTAAALPVAGEAAAWARWQRFRAEHLADYGSKRDLPGRDATSRLSVDLKFGTLHPRQLLAVLRDALPGSGAWVFRSELAWREFYAEVLWQRPESAWRNYAPKMDRMRIDRGPRADERFAAWCEGRTGFPFIDAGMRQLLAEGWMHNRVRMAAASFLVKDLHLDWQRGAAWFMHHLLDGDLASNQHGWQWTAGTGTDAAPYFRIFNPTKQGRTFDPDGHYIRRHVTELAHWAGDVHEPYGGAPSLFGGDEEYPAPIVDHAVERAEALARLAELRKDPA